MEPIEFVPAFVNTKNSRNFNVLMDGLSLSAGEGRMGIIYGQAGLGKSRTVRKWHSEHLDTVYLRACKAWDTSYTEFLQALCRELMVKPIPKRKGRCFAEAVDALIQSPRTVFVDEIEKLPGGFIEIIRDLSDISLTAFVLLGEEELVGYMRRNRRVWDRTFERLEFEPIGAGDIIVFMRECSGGRLKISKECGRTLGALLNGNLRDAKRTLLKLIQICNAKKCEEPTVEMVEIAHRAGRQEKGRRRREG